MQLAIDNIIGRLGLPAEQAVCTLYHNYDPRYSSMLLFIFKNKKQRQAEFVLKLSRDSAALEREYKSLQQCGAALQGIAPRPLLLDSISQYTVLATNMLPGRRLSDRSERLAKLALITNSLTKLHQGLAAQCADKISLLQSLQQVVEKLHATIGDHELLADCRKRISLLSDFTLPAVAQHGDLFFDNIFLHHADVSFLDWEDYGTVRLPAYDLFFLLQALIFVADGSLLDIGRRDREFLHAASRYYLSKMAIPSQAVPAILLYTFMQQYLHALTTGRSSIPMFAARLSTFLKNSQIVQELLC